MSASSEAEREELGYQYSPSRWSTRLPAGMVVDAHSEAIIAATKTARETLQCDLGIEYLEPGGPVLDIYHPQSTSGALGDVVFVWYHGGYWVAFGVGHAGVAAVPLTKHGATVVAVGYTLAPKADMTRIVQECRESAVFLRKRFPDKRCVRFKVRPVPFML
ncbi:Kynurenine formamidase [Geodia barretti]|uniref:Kynurenine formamidase n=1 Tax=Geodia barretti TaxID=519541 RepID=A0AA35S5E2_GEOBA|nr:Kynurenine formamidase [Geodia barretti]